jgi:Fe-S cluster assembly ATPase SufC
MPANEMLKVIRENQNYLKSIVISRSLNEGFSGGEKT